MRKTILALTLLCAVLLAACAPRTAAEDPSAPDGADAALLPSDEGKTVTIGYLGLELAMDEFDPQDLLTLAGSLSPLLQSELLARGYDVSEIGCTIGPANLMTAQALNEGGVDIAILPTGAYAEACLDQARPVLGASATFDYTCGLYAACSSYGEKLTKKSSLTWADLEKARWGVLTEGDTARAYASLYLADNYEGSTLDLLSDVTVFETEGALLSAAKAGNVDIAVLSESDSLTLLAETSPVYTAVAAVTRADEVICSDSFVRALRESLTAILETNGDLFALYDIASFTPIQDADLDPARRLTTITH